MERGIMEAILLLKPWKRGWEREPDTYLAFVNFDKALIMKVGIDCLQVWE